MSTERERPDSSRVQMAMSKNPTTFVSSHVVCFTIVFMVASFCTTVTSIPLQYAQKRETMVIAEQNLRTGGNGSSLNDKEKQVDDILMQEKKALIEATRLNGADFPASHNFLNQTARAAMEATRGYQIIRKMPKGGVLHIHDTAITSIDWLVKNVTYRDQCYMCVDKYGVKFLFSNSAPQSRYCVYRPVSEFRAESGNISAFDQSLYDNISLETADPDRAYPNVDVVWSKFSNYFRTVGGLVMYAPVYEDFLFEGLRQFHEDNVQYLELRLTYHHVYELNGTTHDSDWLLALYRRVIYQFEQQHPDFIGVRLIMSASRSSSTKSMLSTVQKTMGLYATNSDLVRGFDVVGQEDPHHSLLFYIDDLLYPSLQNPPVYLPYFFHAGETDWQGTATDYNLVDAVLLNATRIGHGYALYKHPLILEKMRHQDIAVEVNAISNQVLKLVDDPRNHPAASLIATNFPVVISSDDPAAWGATPLSHDFYVAFMTLTGEDSGLATLKQLAINSLRYSALTADEKHQAIISWQKQWDTFIDNVLQANITLSK